jgi:drug/metabolite transporter (DMT)-like permease
LILPGGQPPRTNPYATDTGRAGRQSSAPIGQSPMPSPTPFGENLRGIASISACNLLFLTNDTIMKVVSVELPLGEILLLRGIVATLWLGIIVAVTRTPIRLPVLANRAVFWRTVSEIVSAYLYLVALFQIPIANANVILQVVPLMVTAGAAIFLKEPVGWRRWTAITVGFVGVLVVIRPGLAGFNQFSVLALASAAFIALRDLTTRIMPVGVSTLAIALVTAVAVGLSGPVYAVIVGERWILPSAQASGLILTASVFLIGGYLTSVDFMRHGDIAVTAPFRYTAIIWAVISGYVVWREIPDLTMVLGTLVIIATGVYTFHRERLIAMRGGPAMVEEEPDHPLA